MQIHNGRPIEKSLITDKFGVSRCMKEIQNKLSKEMGESIPEEMIEPLLREGIQNRNDDLAKKTDQITRKYVSDIMKRLVDYGYKEGLVHLYVVGSGGCLLKHYSNLTSKPNVTFIDIFVLMQKDMNTWQSVRRGGSI